MKKLQAQNEYLRNQLSEYRENCNRNPNDYLSSSISQLTTDVTTLKAKLKEMEQLKNSMDESYKETVQEYHFTVVEQFTELKQQLDESRLKSEALDHSIVLMAKKLEQISYGKVRNRIFICKMRIIWHILKDEQSKIMEQQWIDKIKTICERFDSFTKEKNKELQLKQDLLEKKDTELSKKDVRRREEIELLINKIHNLETKLEMKIRDEDKLQKIINEQYTVMREELNKMRIEMDNETQKQNQNLTSQVSVLKKAIVKLAKSKEKLEYNYEKKLSHIIKNKDTEIKFLHLQLQKQKNELYTSLSTEKQNEMDNIASALEKRYKALLAETEAMSETKTQEYLMRIAILEDQILNMKKFESSL
ncbi:ankyrin repeat domain-containing protein 26-like [Frieseomelitta varia]|uniref:ankyrin repeat domain-containing protein 26-like n=1 Tax=Frieseomelitta varia TaxID=561572 RepID=UPI001CB6980A|nr:ankyrin repeat domain-containing protein 26-like [Frieseomelitta varia]